LGYGSFFRVASGPFFLAFPGKRGASAPFRAAAQRHQYGHENPTVQKTAGERRFDSKQRKKIKKLKKNIDIRHINTYLFV
jgi:hypothetical protein